MSSRTTARLPIPRDPVFEIPDHGPEGVQGYLAEFDDVDGLLSAAERVRDAGYTVWDCHTPFPVHGLERAMGAPPSFLQWIVLICGLTGMTTGLVMQWWMNAVDYPYMISGKPMWSLPANIPVIFELTVLFSAFGAFFGMLLLNGLPKFWHPVFYSDRFKRATDDRFFISIEASDPKFDVDRTRTFAESLGAISVEKLGGGRDA